MIEDVYPLSPLQEGFYYHWLAFPASPVYFQQTGFQLEGALDLVLLEKSYHLLVSRHAILRSFFTRDFGERLLQVVRKEVASTYSYTDVSKETNFSVEAYKEADRQKGFNLNSGSQIRLSVLTLADNKHELIWSNHHILMDGWCMGILIREFFQIYQHLVRGKEPKLAKVSPYSTYIQWLEKQDANAADAYWKSYLSGYDALAGLPARTVKTEGEYQPAESKLVLEGELRQSLKKLCRELAITENTFIQSVWGILLGKYNTVTDAVFGSVVSGRPADIDGIEEMIGLFINTIPVRVHSKEKQPVSELLLDMQKKAIEGADYHYTQLATIQAGSDLGQNLFDHILVFENYPVQEMVEESMENMGSTDRSNALTLVSSDAFDRTNFDFTIIVYPGETITFKFSYNKNTYDETTIGQLKEHLLKIITEVLKDPKQTTEEIDYLSAEEKNQLLIAFNDTKAAFPDNRNVVELFEEQVEKNPSGTAFIFEDIKMSYAGLNEKANRLAAYLRKNYSLGTGDLAGLVLPRNEWAVVSMLAVLKTGAAYVPVDNEYPQDRIDYMLEDSQCKALVNEAELEKFRAEENKWDSKNIRSGNKPTDPAYIIYTSGSTGKPKGVIAPHKGIIRLVKNTNYVDVNESDRILSMSNFVFDGSTFDIYGALLNGAALVFTDKNALLNMSTLDNLIGENNVSMFFITTALFNIFADHDFKNMEKVKKIMFGGELVSVSHVEKFRNKYRKTELLHVYGPTENTTFSTWYKIGDIDPLQKTIPIGNSISNSTAYILDTANKLVPVGVVGELHVGGSGLALGYINNVELTRSKFIENPYVPGELVYKTGDLVKWLPDGSIEFIGRKDDQVKIRGHRIELGEIEHAIASHPDISEALVIARADNSGEKNLVAYYLGSKETDPRELKKYLSALLPVYMVPLYYVMLDKFPLTINGKINKALLPSPEGTAAAGYTAPQDEMEEQLSAIWAEVLGIDRAAVGVDHNFFELGGNSIKIIKLSQQISKAFEQQISIPLLFEYATIRDFASFLGKTDETIAEEAVEEDIEAQEETVANEQIAIIGISGQFSGSDDYRQYWKKLSGGEEMLKTFTDEELLSGGMDRSDLDAPDFVRTSGVINNKEFFDHGFFEFTAGEAALMDPQIRLFYQHCWSALEDAGQTPLIHKQKIGLFAGASENRNWKIYTYGKAASSNQDAFFIDKISNSSYINTLISYKLNLRGPSVLLDTACSTSLVAVDVACDNLLKKRCSIALAGGVNITTTKSRGYWYAEGMISSVDGHCRAFDEGSTGTAHGEGAGVVVLKRLSEAVKDGDHIYAVIKATAVNNDGHLKVGYTAPSVKGQSDCIRMAHKMAGIDPRTISYVETHGTGTKLGDPIEIRALNEAFGTGGSEKHCAIGSVKTNIGHLDIAAGIAGLIKTALSLKNKKIVPSLHFKSANPEIDFAGGPFYVNTELKDWLRKDGTPLRAGVSSFGIGGTNVHAILEEAPEVIAATEREQKLMIISAKTEKSLHRYQQDMLEHLLAEPEISLSDLCYTLQTGRKHFTYRKAIAFGNVEELKLQLSENKKEERIIKSKERNRSLVFMFPGQGAQYAGMGKALYEKDVVFKRWLDKGFNALKKLTGTDHKTILFGTDPAKINETQYTQPILFIFEYALARLVMSWGLKPAGMIGHSIGEYVAACISGVFSYEDALKVVVKRGALMSKVEAGSMISVPLKEEEARLYLEEGMSLAAVNGPEQCVFSGTNETIEKLIKELGAQQVPFVKLHTSHAFHSAMLNNVLEEFENELKKIKLLAPQIPFISNLTGKEILTEEAISVNYWSEHMRETVKFSQGITLLRDQRPEKIYIEIGPGDSLTKLVRQHQVENIKPVAINLVRHIKEAQDDLYYITDKIGQLWAQGLEINWQLYYKDEKRRKISLPTYSFEKIKYPAEVEPFEKGSLLASGRTTAANSELKDWIYYPSWKSSVLETSSKEAVGRSYLLFSAANELSGSIKAKLSSNANVVEVCSGKHYKKESANRYYINPSAQGDYKLLVADLAEEQINITDIVHCWSMIEGTLEWKSQNEKLGHVYFSMVFISQALHEAGLLSGKRIWAITSLLQNVLGNENIAYHSSLVLGVLNVLAQEYPVKSFNIDLDLSKPLNELALKAAEEILHNSKDRYVAIRNGKRWLKEYQRQTGTVLKERNVIKPGGTILITGGLGNVGTTLLNYLLKSYDSKIAVMGRRGLNPELEKRLADLNLNNKGRAVYYQGDIANRKSLENIISEIESENDSITGVIHAAGVTNVEHFDLIDDISIDESLEIFAPKTQGIENIYEVFKTKQPDFVWVTSNIASASGGLSFSSYSANLYMDHFIVSKTAELSNWKCINLSEMVFQEEAVKNEKESARQALLPDELCALFDWSINSVDYSQLVVTVRDLHNKTEITFDRKKERYTAEFDAGTIEKLERPDLTTAYIAPGTETEAKLVMMIETFFGISNIGVEDNFFELGGDSLKAMVLLKRVKKEWNVNISLKDFFAKQNIREVATDIDNLLWIATDVQMDNEITI
jgi:polyketide synthase PksJ